MYEVFKEMSFSGAHHLRNYHGKCEEVHGHNWLVRVYARADELDAQGMVVDFTELKKAMKEVLSALDHRDVNTVPPFDTMNPSAENLARFIFDGVSEKINDKKVTISRVMVWETDESCAVYTR